uniref:Uncharacterized protein n=1 Tax=Arundo donax TaxID=35708 RepID=A0A0A8YYS1_ARUDO
MGWTPATTLPSSRRPCTRATTRGATSGPPSSGEILDSASAAAAVTFRVTHAACVRLSCVSGSGSSLMGDWIAG